MQVCKDKLLHNIDRISNMHAIYKHLTNSLKFNQDDVADIIRSEIVYLISAFDRLIHDLVKIGMIEIFLGNRPMTAAYKKFTISIEQSNMINNSTVPPPEFVFEQIIVKSHKHLSFQEPDKISNALSLIWDENHKWQKIATELGLSQNDVKIKLKNLVIRRNQIVHESDIDLFSGNLLPIFETDVESATTFIKDLGCKIYELVQ